jgi:hypothetical protein
MQPDLPGAETDEKQNTGGNDVGAVARPDSLGLFAPDVFFDFAEDITHSQKPFRRGAALAEALEKAC